MHSRMNGKQNATLRGYWRNMQKLKIKAYGLVFPKGHESHPINYLNNSSETSDIFFQK